MIDDEHRADYGKRYWFWPLVILLALVYVLAV